MIKINCRNVWCAVHNTFIFNTYSNMTSFIDYINNTMVKFPIYFNAHMRIVEHIIYNIPKWIHIFIQDRSAFKHKYARIISLHIFLFPEKILKTTIYRLSLLCFIVFRWRSLQETLVTVTQVYYDCVDILLAYVATIKIPLNSKIAVT